MAVLPRRDGAAEEPGAPAGVRGHVSHELRTPLTNIRSYAETLSDSAGDIPPAMEKKFLGVILGESDRMTHIVQDLLTLSRFDSGRDDLKLARFSFERRCRTCTTRSIWSPAPQPYPGAGAGGRPARGDRRPGAHRPGDDEHCLQLHQIYAGRGKNRHFCRPDRGPCLGAGG